MKNQNGFRRNRSTTSQILSLHRILLSTSPWYGYVWNVHRMSIKIEHRNLEIRKTRNDFSVQVRNFLLPLSLKVFRHKERGTIFIFRLFHLLPPPILCGTYHKGLRQQAKANRLLPRQVSTLLTFFKFPKILCALPVRDVICTCLPRFSSRAIVTSLSDTSTLSARVNTCVNVAPK